MKTNHVSYASALTKHYKLKMKDEEKDEENRIR